MKYLLWYTYCFITNDEICLTLRTELIKNVSSLLPNPLTKGAVRVSNAPWYTVLLKDL